MIAGAAAGALTGALSDFGINDKFMKEVSEVLKPGQAALFIMARTHASDRVLEELGKGGGRIIRTNLDTKQEERVRKAFNEAVKEIPEHHAGV